MDGLGIVLRTVCGCERVLYIPFRHYPPDYRVPYMRNKNWHVFPKDGDTCMTTSAFRHVRTFERTPQTGLYGYPVYLEKLEDK